MNPSSFTVSPNTHVSQVFNLFRTMGLRHLPVVNAVGEVSLSSSWRKEKPVPGATPASVAPLASLLPFHPPSGKAPLASALLVSQASSTRRKHQNPAGRFLRPTPPLQLSHQE